MPVGQQIAAQAASSYQHGLGKKGTGTGTGTGAGVGSGMPGLPAGMGGVTGGAKGASAPTGFGLKGPSAQKPKSGPGTVITQGQPATGGYSVVAGMSPEELIKINSSLGLSSDFQTFGEPQTKLFAAEKQTAKDAGEGADIAAEKAAEFKEFIDELTGSGDASGGPLGQSGAGNIFTEAYGEGKEVEDISLAEEDAPGTAQISKELGKFQDEYDYGALDDSGKPAAPGEYEFDDTLGADQVEKIEQNVTDYLESVENDFIGMDPELKTNALDQLDQKYAVALEKVMMGLDRQYANAGMFGSANHAAALGTAFSDTLAQYAQEYMELEVLDAKMVEEDYAEKMKQMESMNQQYKTVLDWYDRHETLQQAAAQLGVEKFAKEVQLYLGGQENELTKMGIDQDTIDQFIEQSGLDLDAWKAGVEKENLEEVLEQSQEKIYNEQQKGLMEMATMLGESTATMVGGIITWVQDNYGQPARTEIQQSIYSIHQGALQAIADGQDYSEVMEQFYAALTDLLSTLGQD